MIQQAKERIVIIGFGPVAASLVEGLLPGAAAGTIELTVVSSEKHLAYNRVLLAELAIGSTRAEHLGMVDETRLLAAGVILRMGRTVKRVDRSRRHVLFEDAAPLGYDRLVFATGARPTIPPLNGLNFDPHADAQLPQGVLALRTIEDAENLNGVLQGSGRVLVLGGGILGIEAALAMAESGHHPVLIHHGPAPLGRVVDADGGKLLIRNLRDAGVEVISEARATGIQKDETAFTGLITQTHGVIEGAALVLSTGVRARTELASSCGLGVNRGIKTNEHLAADTEHRIFAIGDCAEVAGQAPMGLLAPGWAQAGWLAQYMLNTPAPGPADPTLHDPIDLAPPALESSDVLMLKGQGIELTAGGNISDGLWDESGSQVTVYADPAAGKYLKMVSQAGVLTGFLAMGLPRTSAELVLSYERGSSLPADRSTLLRLDDPGTLEPVSAPGPDDQLCRCSGATHGQVAHAVESGCTTVAEVGTACRAGTGCGGCRAVIEEMLKMPVPA
ncbi:FAD-dependent oxidoreductase [Glutamicibacter arilaitensis]|uniref:FAD-dependent oxidoreductase n=1 Tax=Glutamicibacter arilaitensis TaxID=256701 RepID=UPI00384A49C3